MANITPYTNQIRTARYGEEVRGSIVNALEAMNSDINDDTASAQAYAGQASVSAQAAATTASGLTNILTELSTLETQVSTAEGLRGTAEAGRVSAENARVVAEAARENEETGYVAQCAAYAAQAQTYATSDNAMLSKSWAVGDTAGSREGEATNNSRYWAQQSEALADAKGQQWNTTLGTTAASYLHGGTGTRTGEDTDNAEYYAEQAEAWATGGASGTPSATNNAQYYAQQSLENANTRGEYWEDRLETAAQSWVEGGTGSRSGEDTNNAKYWSEQAYSWYEQAGQVVTEGGVTSFNNRSGVVVATSGDYNADMITRGTGSVESALQSIEAGVSDNEDAITALQSDKVDKDEALLSLDTTAAASTVDGALTAALTALGWLSDVIES